MSDSIGYIIYIYQRIYLSVTHESKYGNDHGVVDGDFDSPAIEKNQQQLD